MPDHKPNLRIVEQTPWSDPRSYRPDPFEMLRERYRRPSTFERISAAIDVRGFLPFYAGTVFGAFMTVALAWVWSAL